MSLYALLVYWHCRKPTYDLDKMDGAWKKATPLLGNVLELLTPNFHRKASRALQGLVTARQATVAAQPTQQRHLLVSTYITQQTMYGCHGTSESEATGVGGLPGVLASIQPAKGCCACHVLHTYHLCC